MNELTQLADKYGTDKGTAFDGQHNYTSLYYELFSEKRADIHSLLEIGIFRGASVKMWRDFFFNAEVHCIDINPEFVSGVEGQQRITAAICDQSSRTSISGYINSLRPAQFDIIIDDGSHQMEHQQISFALFFPLLKSGGAYILEDLSTSLNANYTTLAGGYEKSSLNMFKRYQQTKQWESSFMTSDELFYLNKYTQSSQIHEWENPRTKEKKSITSLTIKK